MLRRSFSGFHGTFCSLRSFKNFILYTTSVASKDGITNPLMVQLLVNSVGFSENEAVSVVAKVSNTSKSTKKSKLVVDFLRNSGLDETHIRRVVTTVPNVLHIDVEKNLKPKFRVLQELGFSGSDLGLFISQNPYVLQRSIEGHIVPALEMMKSLIGSNEELVRFVLKLKSQRMMSSNVVKYLPDNLLLLQSYGIPRERRKWFFLTRPSALLSRTQWFEKVVKKVEEKLGISRESAMFLHGVYALCMTSEEKLESWPRILGSHGWRETEISNLLRLNPMSLTMSEKALRAKLKYYMEDLGFGSDYLSKRTVLLSFSLEKRIKPRTTVMQTLKEKQLLKKDISMPYFASLTESKFVEKYVLPFKDELPELYESYTRANGSSVSKP